jgi:dihydropteroate synthase
MGILNVTPDSFSDGGRYAEVEAAVAAAAAMAAAGVDLIDIGGESTRPGSEPVPADEQLRRVLPVIERIVGLGVPISIDTTRVAVAGAALDAGATIVNDVSGLRDDPGLADLVAERGCGLVVMHSRGTPRDMQRDPRYHDVVRETGEELDEAVGRAEARGVRPDQVVVDPGIGFGKAFEHNMELLGRLPEFVGRGRPVLVGVSRKSFLGRILDAEVGDRLAGSLAAAVAAVLSGVHIVRAHDVEATVRAVKVTDAIRNGVPAR